MEETQAQIIWILDLGLRNIYCAAEIWKLCQNAVEAWRDKLDATQWLDLKYEELVTNPHGVMRTVCDFLGEEYSEEMMLFHNTEIAKSRGASRDHAPLGRPVSDEYIGIYKNFLSHHDQGIFSAVAGEELIKSGYEIDVNPVSISDEEVALNRDLDGRNRAATLDAPHGHIIYESYNDWLVDQRAERKRQGIWSDKDVVNVFPIGHQLEEMISGQRASRKWKEYLNIKRQYSGTPAL